MSRCKIIEEEHTVDAIRSFINCNDGDEATEMLLISVGSEILDVSEDKFLEMLEKNKV